MVKRENNPDKQTVDFRPGEPPIPPGSADAKATAGRSYSVKLSDAFGDRYELGAQLGAGMFGAVFAAVDRRLNRAIAIKVSPARSSDQDQLLREARALAQLRHPGIVSVHDVAVTRDYCFVVSELLPGPSLSSWLQHRRPTILEAVQITAAIADALAHAHCRSIVHRDVKPSNIVFDEGHRPVLVDFGLALSDLDVAAEHGAVAGTPSYMSPEQASGRGHRPDGRTDIYGLAATMYAMLCGRAPFRGKTAKDVLRQVREDEPQPPRQIRPELPPELERVCLKGLAKLPGDRFMTAADFAEAIRRSVDLLPAILAPSASAATPHVLPSAAPVPALSTKAESRSPSHRMPQTQRRQITLLQCDCESRGGEDDDDPMERVATFQEVCAEVVEKHGGTLLQASGATFLACFGYPVAHEDAPRQAVRAALAICQQAGAVSAVAVGTGSAMVTEQLIAAPIVVGDVVAITSTLLAQGTCPGVMLTESTFRLVEGFFDCEPAGEIHRRGAAEPLPIYVVRAERAARNRMEATNHDRLTPLIGRSREVELLIERWELTAEGVQNVILLVADPGLGKSRLVRVLRDYVLQRPEAGPAVTDSVRSGPSDSTVVQWHCSPYHQASSFYPVIDYFDRAYQLSREPDPARRLDRLITGLREDGIHDPTEQTLFAAMLSLPDDGRLPACTLSPERQREKTQEALLAWLSARAEQSAVLFVVEDLHWIDPSTEALLAQFVDRSGDTRVLAVFTFRPEYDPPWKGNAVQTQVALNRLTRAQVTEMIRRQAGDQAIPQASIDQIIERTDGVPLFVEEFTQLLVERGYGAESVGTVIPTTLQDLLLARLDRMSSDQEVVQLGAAIGRTFAHSVIQAVSELDATTLDDELDKLVGAGLLFIKGAPPRCTYTFKHALIQDAAYQSMVKKRRQQFHRAIAEKLEEQFTEIATTQPELLAHHFTEAGLDRRGIDYWLAAGQRARDRSAYREAIRHFNRGLELVATLPESDQRDRLELQFQIPLSTATTIACGWGDPGLEAIYLRARQLCDRIGPEAPTFAVTWGQWAWCLLRAELDLANDLAADLQNQAAALDDGHAMEACFATACTTLFRGEFDRCLADAPRGLALHDPERCAVHARYTGQNAFCTTSAFYSWALAICGYFDRAFQVADESIRLSQGNRDKYSEQFARYHFGCVQQHFRLGSAARAIGEDVVAVGTEHGFAIWVALGTLCYGAGMVIEGIDIQRGLDVLDTGIRAFKTTGAELSLSSYLAVTTEGYRKIALPDRAWATLEEAFAMVERTGERFHLSNLHRIRGDLLLDRSPAQYGEAEASYRLAIDIARQQHARSWELRATTSLCHLLCSQPGRHEEALAALTTLSSLLTDGFQTPDLLEAKALVDAHGLTYPSDPVALLG